MRTTAETPIPYSNPTTVEERLSRLEARHRQGRIMLVIGIACVAAVFVDQAAQYWPTLKLYLGW